MTKQIHQNNRHLVWAFGHCYDFNIATSTIALNQSDYGGSAANPETKQKHQIVLHCTAGNNSAEITIEGWNNNASYASAHYIVERTRTPQCNRPPQAAGSTRRDIEIVDAVRAMEDNTVTYHAGMVNRGSIGIEIANVAWGWYAANTNSEPTLAGGHSPVSSCPSPINIGSQNNPNWKCNHARPQDHNRYIHLTNPLGGRRDYQAFEIQQYKTLILLLRHICITNRIPRKFLGMSTEEVFRRWAHDGTAAERRVNRSTVFHYRGIFHHRNVSQTKPCPGVLHRNQIFRGIIDEWWLPVELEGDVRDYYSGPFEQPAFSAGNQRDMFFRAGVNGQISGATCYEADLDALCEAASYFNFNELDPYFQSTETFNGGYFPIGRNRVWHGGVHLQVLNNNPCVYAAASGTIVAARLSSNSATDNHEDYGSQRFVLIRHAVYLNSENDPNGVGTRIHYQNAPVYIFSLYMHFDDVADMANENENNPPWFNMWRRNNPQTDIGMEGEKGRVFAPDIEVSVGDILGNAGTFCGSRLIHFELMTHRDTELTMAPWDTLRAFDDTDDNICNMDILNQLVIHAGGEGVENEDMRAFVSHLRTAKTYHTSEWALNAEDQLAKVVQDEQQRAQMWAHISRFTWVAEAIAVNPDLENQLSDVNGMMWHYHPITFMNYINELILGENREIQESEYHDTNVEINDDYFFIRFIDWDDSQNAFVPADADSKRIEPGFIGTDNSNIPDAYVYHFNRQDIACAQCVSIPPFMIQNTNFSAALLELLEKIRLHYNRAVYIDLSFVCTTHGNQRTLCIMNPDNNDNDHAMERHEEGVAIDYHPANPNPANCRDLWNSTAFMVTSFAQLLQNPGQSPTQADLPHGYNNVRARTFPLSVQEKLTAQPQQSLTASEAQDFRIHLELLK